MLGRQFPLYLPKLKSTGSRAKTGLHGEAPLYTLDWSPLEKAKNKYADHFVKTKEVPAFEGEWLDFTDNTLYVVNAKYLTAIRHFSQQAVDTWGTEWPFDTYVRGWCLDPAQALLFAAFKLLADCSYDPETDYYLRDVRRQFLPNALAFKTWFPQTSYSTAVKAAELPELQTHLDKHLIEKQAYDLKVDHEYDFCPEEVATHYEVLEDFLAVCEAAGDTRQGFAEQESPPVTLCD